MPGESPQPLKPFWYSLRCKGANSAVPFASRSTPSVTTASISTKPAVKPQNSANHLVCVGWPSKFNSLKGRDGRPRPSHLSAGWRCEWKELDSLKSKRLAIRFLRVLSGRKARHGAARPPRPTISGNPACSTLRRFRGQTLSCEPKIPESARNPHYAIYFIFEILFSCGICEIWIITELP